MRVPTYLATIVLAAGVLTTGCATAPPTEAKRAALSARSNGSLEEMKAHDANLDAFLDRAYGYAIFPSVGKGGFIVGGGYGRGEVYEQGEFIGYADISQATVGLQAGGGTYSQLIVFKDRDAMDRFKYGKMKLAANASAVALKAGASATARYSDGVAVFTLPQGGLMVEAAIGGQEFGFAPARDEEARAASGRSVPRKGGEYDSPVQGLATTPGAEERPVDKSGGTGGGGDVAGDRPAPVEVNPEPQVAPSTQPSGS